jgi:hypothetical protein
MYQCSQFGFQINYVPQKTSLYGLKLKFRMKTKVCKNNYGTLFTTVSNHCALMHMRDRLGIDSLTPPTPVNFGLPRVLGIGINL